MLDAIKDVLAERTRQQKEEGHTVEHDMKGKQGTLVYAAINYCGSALLRHVRHQQLHDWSDPKIGGVFKDWCMWPWNVSMWKPTTYRRDLVKATALLIAEIERYDNLIKAAQD